jgi:N-acetylglucosamine kinase-like BadF-type ATPase
MYTLIADSGSTKTDWVVCRGSDVLNRVRTIGLNPYFHTRDEISREIINHLKPGIKDQISQIAEVHYYGTGCSTPANCTLVRDCLTMTLEVEKVNVSHDLLAAARALCGREWGIAAILGTGSNSGLYDGERIVENVPSAGYLWSDYGGGSQIGKYLIRDYFEERLPDDLRSAFESAGYNREVILDNVYRRGMPSRYLASVSLFAGERRSHPYMQKLLEECFDSFFEQQVSRYTNSKRYLVHTVGSVGYFYRELIARVAKKHGYATGRMIQSPMEGLIGYHSTAA